LRYEALEERPGLLARKTDEGAIMKGGGVCSGIGHMHEIGQRQRIANPFAGTEECETNK